MRLLFLFICVSISLDALADNNCPQLFKGGPRLVQLQTGVEAGSLTLDRETRILTKVYNRKWEFENALVLDFYLRKLLTEAGYKIPEILTVDIPNLTVTKPYVKGLTLDEFSKKTLPKDLALWEKVFKQHEAIFLKAQRALYREAGISFADRSSGGQRRFFHALTGDIHVRGRRQQIVLHEKNIVVHFNPETKETEFHIIDLR